MYLPRHFEQNRTEILHQLIVTHPLGALVSLSADGLSANHIPFQLVAEPPPRRRWLQRWPTSRRRVEAAEATVSTASAPRPVWARRAFPLPFVNRAVEPAAASDMSLEER
jgi:hypothetical protein